MPPDLLGQNLEVFAKLGEPGGAIDRLAQQQRADLVMLATHGHGPVRRFLLGSTTAKVLHDVGAAVWTGVGAALADHPVRIPYQSIVCPLDDSQEAEGVLHAAASIASAYSGQLLILHASADAAVIDALLVDGIHHDIVRRKADLLITGRGHSTGTFSRMWLHLYAIIRDSPCPVLSI